MSSETLVPVITEEAVEAAAQVYAVRHTGLPATNFHRDVSRAALTAAAPHMVGRAPEGN